jgi:hypothetical protein
MKNKLTERDGQFYLDIDGEQVFLCGSALSSSCETAIPSDVAITSLAALNEVVAIMAQGLCPLCSKPTRLVVESAGRYVCYECETTFVNDQGFRLPALFVDELILGVSSGKSVAEMTTTGAIPARPGRLATVKKTTLDYTKSCPHCYETLNLRGECPKCNWSPSGRDKLWERVTRIVERVVEVWNIGDSSLEFELGGELCKIYLEDVGDGLRYKARLKNINRDSVREVIGRDTRIINCVLDWTNVEPASSTNFSSTPPARRVSAGPAESVTIQVGTEDDSKSLENLDGNDGIIGAEKDKLVN